jgi:hypothetical protein
MGGTDAVPETGDEVDMVEILRELTLPDVDLDEDENGKIKTNYFKSLNVTCSWKI